MTHGAPGGDGDNVSLRHEDDLYDLDVVGEDGRAPRTADHVKRDDLM